MKYGREAASGRIQIMSDDESRQLGYILKLPSGDWAAKRIDRSQISIEKNRTDAAKAVERDWNRKQVPLTVEGPIESKLMYHVDGVDQANAGDVQIEVRHDGTVLWVNVDGICRLRVCRIRGKITIADNGAKNIEVEI